MNIKLTPEQEKFVAERVLRGEYPSFESVLEEGLKLIRAREQFYDRVALLQAQDDLERGIVSSDKTREGETGIQQPTNNRPRPQPLWAGI